MVGGSRLPRHHDAIRHGDAGLGHHDFGDVLIHGERRGERAGMAVGNLQDLKQALNGAVLAGTAMQQVEGDVGRSPVKTVAMSRATSMRVTR